MAIITAYDRMGFGLNMVDTESSFVPNSNDLIIPDGDPSVRQYDYDTLLISQWYNGYQIGFGIYTSQYSGDIWTIESFYFFNSDTEPTLGAYNVNIRFNITDDFSEGTYFTNLHAGNDVISGNKYADIIKSGAGNDTLKGNAGNDYLYGETGNDVLKGVTGKDVLYGGSGADKFVFDTALNASTNQDTIKDFARNSDKIVLDDDIFKAFTGKSGVSSKQFKVVDKVSQLSGDGHLTYVRANDTLYYDAYGKGSGDVAFVKIELAGNAAPSASDFQVIA
jgi:Ca2+-binding RTX toxin-like protein